MGFGTSTAGLCPVGLYDVTEPTAPPKPSEFSRFLGTDGQYVIDGVSGGFARMPRLKQRIVLAVATVLGSSTVQPDWGLKIPAKMTATFDAQVAVAIRKALRRLTDVERLMLITDIRVERDTWRARATVVYVDLSDGQTSEVSVEPR
jgi:hypothetical protein